MKKIEITTTTGIVQSLSYLRNVRKFDNEIAVIYLSILNSYHSKDDNLEPIPIWFYGLPKASELLRLFNSFNLITKIGNTYNLSAFLNGDDCIFSLADSSNIELVNNLSIHIGELNSYLSAS